MTVTSKADQLLADVYSRLGLVGSSEIDRYKSVEKIVSELETINAQQKIHEKTTGTITERLCELALKGYLGEGGYERLPSAWKWLADFSVLGRPLNVLVSVKSLKAKERLLMSGSGSAIAPTVGFGLFDDETEWSVDRLSAYLLRGFVAIYMPTKLLSALETKSEGILKVTNLNGNKLLRPLDRFGSDLRSALSDHRVDPRKL